jgi:aerobic C4-dicarboxylate transport protein
MIRTLAKLHVQLFLGLGLGILIGCVFPHAGPYLKPLADAFIKIVRMLLAPIIFVTVVAGIARMGDIKSVGRVGLKALIYFEIVSAIALLIGMIVVNVVHPGEGMNIDAALLDARSVANYAVSSHRPTLIEFLLNVIPNSAAGAFVDGNMLQVLFLSIPFGIALSRLGEKKNSLIHLLDVFLQAMFGVVRMAMYLAPLAALGSMAFIVGQFGPQKLLPYARLIGCVYGTCVIFILCVLFPICRFCGVSLFSFLRYIRAELLITFGTCSTEAVLPQTMAKLESLGCEPTLVGMVFPAGYALNADGTSIYLALATIFIAQATHVSLSLGDQLMIFGILLLTSKGSGGIAGAGFVALAATLASIDRLPIGGLALLLAVESLLNQARAVTNLIGNSVATIAVGRWEGKVDVEKMNCALMESNRSSKSDAKREI